MRRLRHRRLAAACAFGAACASAHAQVALDKAWMRPAAAGQKEAQVYVDIRASEPLRLVGASSPIAQRAELVLLDPPDPDTGKLRTVREIAVAANQDTRLAFRGSHVRLLDVVRDAGPGERVRVELRFVDSNGNERVVATEALVRGLVPARAGEPAQQAPK